LKALNEYENTLVIVTRDHGEAFGEGGWVGHGGLYLGQAVVHVPLVIKYPRDRRARRVDSYVSLIDVFPTILDVLQVPERPQVQGTSLLEETRPDEVISEGVVGELGKQESSRAIIADGMKLVMSNVAQPALYDLSADPDETTNLYKPGDPRGSALAARLGAWLGGEGLGPGDQTTPDPEALERLKALGYVR
jgi:arylsulfatase A-like enzyme